MKYCILINKKVEIGPKDKKFYDVLIVVNMKTLEEIKKVLREHKEEFKERFKVKEIGIFGSIIRGERRETSDIDILVDFEDDADLFHLVGLALFLEKKLNQKVDLVPKRALREEIKDSVLNEVIPI